MSFEYLTNLPLAEARSAYLDYLKKNLASLPSEKAKVCEANHRISATAIYARISAPHYNAAAMDGIAIAAQLSYGASETTPVTLGSDQYTWVNTGDPIPDGADCVVMVEDIVGVGERLQIYSPATPWLNIRQIGEDISAGDMIIPSFIEITPAMQGALLAAGVTEIEVLKKVQVGFIPTGNELVPPDADPKPGNILEFNSTIFKGILEDWLCQVKVYPIVRDQEALITGSLKLAAEENDLVIINAGSSAGIKDFTASAVKTLGDLVIHGIATKPGKPAILGAIKRGKGTVPVIGLPGYPVSGILVMQELVKPVLDFMRHQAGENKTYIHPTVSRKLNSSLKYLEFIRTQVGDVNGKLVAVPLNRGAGVVSSFIKSDGMIEVPQDREGYVAGDQVNVNLFTSMDVIRNTLVVTGSHDPMIDEISNLMRRAGYRGRVNSSHVGSMGGIMAVKRGEAHLAGIHLLDEASGTYNIPYLQKYFANGQVLLMRGVSRIQGIMLKKENPLRIETVKDLVGHRYVNRQKGSGTRILIDYMFKKEGVDPSSIQGYEREEFTHTAVAAAIAAGTADAGLGIYSAAKIYGLDFVPVGEESYDFLVLETAVELPAFKAFREALQSQALKVRLAEMGGYLTDGVGEFIPWY